VLLRLCLTAGALDGLRTFKHKSGTEILRTDVVIGGKGLRCPFLKDGSFVKEVCTVRDGECFANIVVCYDDSDITVLEFCDDILDILDGDGVNAGERLVKKDESGVHGEGAGDFAAAPLTTGELDSEGLSDL